MAKENKEIGEIVKKCKILLLDIEGTTTSISFVKDKLFPYAEENVKQFLDSQWETEDVKGAVTALRKLAIEDKESSVDGVVTIPGEDATKEEQIEGLVNSVKWQMSADRKAGALKQLQGLIWKQGYDNGDIKGHVYDDVSAALEAWHSTDGQKVYIYSSGSVQAQKLLFGQSQAGDLLRFIDGHFDTAVGGKQEAASYTQIVEKIGCKPDEILFLTDIIKEAEAARGAGLQAALVSREGNAPLPADHAFPVLHSLAELTLSNKRKQDTQEEETPAKVPKTESEGIKTTTETDAPVAAPAEVEPEKMEVEEVATCAEEPKDVPMKEQVTVEEITDSNEAPSVVSVCDIEPVIEEEEKEQKTENIETEAQATDLKDKEGEAPKTEETPPAATVVTEIEEISEKQLADVAEVIEDIVPVVEEPEASEDMEVLQTVGEVLEKECDDILAKVHDVTNLDNIPVKPLLNTIAEETMETDNTDSNDIVERILDTELDLEMKQCGDIDLNTVSEITDEIKTDVVEANGATETSPTETNDTTDTKVTENKEVANGTNKNMEEPVRETEPQETKIDTKDDKSSENENTKTNVEVSAPETAVKSSEKVETNNGSEAAPTVEVVKTVSEKVDATTTEIVKEQKDEPTQEAQPAAEEPQPAVEEAKPTEPAPENGTAEKAEPQVNGNGTNGAAEGASLNGDARKDEELSARLAVENGKVNGANGDAQESAAPAAPPADKLKAAPAAEPRPDPIEQPTQA